MRYANSRLHVTRHSARKRISLRARCWLRPPGWWLLVINLPFGLKLYGAVSNPCPEICAVGWRLYTYIYMHVCVCVCELIEVLHQSRAKYARMNEWVCFYVEPCVKLIRCRQHGDWIIVCILVENLLYYTCSRPRDSYKACNVNELYGIRPAS